MLDGVGYFITVLDAFLGCWMVLDALRGCWMGAGCFLWALDGCWMLFQGAGFLLTVLSDTFIVLSNTFGIGWVLDGLFSE